MNKKHLGIDVPWPNLSQAWAFARKWLLPNPGTLVLMVILVLALPAIAGPSQAPSATSTSTISYQGRLADSGGNPLTGKYNLEFRIYDVPTGGTPLWTEMWTGANAVDVSDGLFNVMLGSIDNTLASSIEGHDELYLGITVGTDSEMEPRVQLGSVPFSMQALTVADGSITTEKIADGAVTSNKLNINASVSMNGYSLNSTGNVNGHGTQQIHMPSGNGDIYLNWHQGGGLHVGGGDQTAKFTVDANGNLWACGTKSAVVQAGEFGQRKLYAAESPEVRFFDEDLAQLENGVARVDLDPIFLETIEGEYLVYLTPYGDVSLYVAEIGRDYFVVRVREGDPDVAFAWRLSAHRKGYAGVRLEATDVSADKRME